MKPFCLICLLFFSFSAVTAQDLLKVGTVAPSIAFKSAFQKNYKIPKNKILILDFWATWCGPCVAGLIESNSFVEKYENKFEYIGVTDVTSVNSAQFIKNQKFNHKFIYDDGKIYEDFGVTGIPHAYIIDKNGIIIWSGYGRDITAEFLDNYLTTGTFKKIQKPVNSLPPPLIQKKQLTKIPTLGKFELAITEDRIIDYPYSARRDFKANKFEFIAQLTSIKNVISYLYADRDNRILNWSNKNLEGTKIAVKVAAENVDPEKTKFQILQAIANRYDFNLSIKNIDTIVYILSIKNQDLLKKTIMIGKKGSEGQGPKYSNSIQMDSYFTTLNATLPELAQNIERQFKVFCRAENAENIGYDFLQIDAPNFEKFKSLLLSKYGVELIEKKEKLEFLVVE